MNASRFIAGRIKFGGKLAMTSIAVSFFIIIIAVSVSAGFRREIREGVSGISGDIQLTPVSMNFVSETDPVSVNLSYMDRLDSVQGVKRVMPVIYRVGIIKRKDDIHGVLFKGIETSDSVGLQVSVPSHLADILNLEVGEPLVTYFVGEKARVRKFTVKEVYPSLLDSDENLVVYASLEDMQRLNGWGTDQVSAFEIMLDEKHKREDVITAKKDEIGVLSSFFSDIQDDDLVATSVMQRFPQLFGWLGLIDFNVLIILVLMSIVAGFNMISGLLVLLFRNISTIGILKSMGMEDRKIAGVFLRVSSELTLKGMAIGNAIALLFCFIQGSTHLIKLDPEQYFVSAVPVSVDIPMILLADVAAYAVILLLTILPVRFISKVDPSKTVRAQ